MTALAVSAQLQTGSSDVAAGVRSIRRLACLKTTHPAGHRDRRRVSGGRPRRLCATRHPNSTVCRSDHDDDPASRRFLLGSPLVGLLERLLVLRAATRPGLTGGSCRGVPPSALVGGVLPICGGELNFKLMDLVPLGVSAFTLRYRQKLLQASAGRHLWWRIHSDIIPSFGRCVPRARRRRLPIEDPFSE